MSITISSESRPDKGLIIYAEALGLRIDGSYDELRRRYDYVFDGSPPQLEKLQKQLDEAPDVP